MYDEELVEKPQSITCPTCGRRMRLNYFLWKEPRYVCDSYRRDNECEMILMISDVKPDYRRSVTA